MLSRLAIPFALLTLVVIFFTQSNQGDDQLIAAYHEQVAQVIQEIPLDFGGWQGQQVPLPQSAISLLRPNALIARDYINQEKGVRATLMVVQCKDTRDMAGHYPPRCYPANGWMESEDNPPHSYALKSDELRVYEFERVAGQAHRDIFVYSIFALPTGELTTSMTNVRKVGADYSYRRYGAAQVQIVIDGEIQPEDHQWILDELYGVAKPAIQAVLNASDFIAQEGGVS